MTRSLDVLPLVLTVPETAEQLRCGRRKIYQLMDSGELVSIKVGGSRRITRDALLAYVDSLAKSA